MSVPFVLYVRVPVVKGSVEGRKGWAGEEVERCDEKGCEERSRIACVMVGWKRPPCGE